MAARKKTATRRGKRAEPKKEAPTAHDALMPTLEVKGPQPWMRISDDAVYRSRLKRSGQVVDPFDRKLAMPPPGVIPRRRAARVIAMDEASFEVSGWAASQMLQGAYLNGISFIGYTYLSELAQRPEYRKISEARAEEATREWITLKSLSNERSQTSKVKELGEFLEHLDLQHTVQHGVELDGYFGRGHFYVDTGSTDDVPELKTPIGNGRDRRSLAKFRGKKGFLNAVKTVEPVWCYPAFYNSIDPLKDDWYDPETWYVMGKEVNKSRLLRIVGAEVPDLLKPSYAFGGLSLSQMAKPYVDNWLRTRQSVADLIWSFSVSVLKTTMSQALQEGAENFFKRLELFANVRTNQGIMAIDKTEEDFANVSTPLGTLDHLQAQAQEQQCSVSSTPVVKLLGIQPTGLNATAEGELTVWYDHVRAYQGRVLTNPVRRIVDLAQISLWGERDPDIDFEWNPLKVMTAKEKADLEKADADRDVAYVGGGILDPVEVRTRLSNDPDGPYHGITPDAAPEQPGMEGLGDEDEDALGGALGERPEDARRDGLGDGRNQDAQRGQRPPASSASGAAGQARSQARSGVGRQERARDRGQQDRKGWDRGGGDDA